MDAPSPMQEENNEGGETKLFRLLRNVLPEGFVSKLPLISKCCEPKEDEVETQESEVKLNPTREEGYHDDEETADEGYQDAQEVEESAGDGKGKVVSVVEERVVVRNTQDAVVKEEVPSMEIGAKEVSFKPTSNAGDHGTARNWSLHMANCDPAFLERAMLIYIESCVSLANRAVGDNKFILADKVVCDMLAKIREVYGVNETDYVPEPNLHPLVRMMERMPKDTPESVREAASSIAEDRGFMNSLVEKILVIDLIDKFNMKPMKSHILNYRQQFLGKLWPSAVETAHYEMRKRGTKESGRFRSIEGCDMDKYCDSLNSTPRVVNRGKMKRVTLPPETNKEETKAMRKPSKYFAYASKIIGSRKNTMFGQHFNKNKVRTADGWVKEPYRALETYYRFEDNGSVSVKVRGKLSTDLLRVICIINEVELASEWVPFLKEAKTLKIYTRTTKIFKQQYEYPVVGTKSTTVLGMGVNVLEEAGCFILSCKGPPETQKDAEQLAKVLREGGIDDTEPFVSFDGTRCKLWDFPVDPLPPKVRQRSADLCFLLYPMERHTLVELYANIVPEVRLVPTRIVTFIIKKVVITIFKRIAQISKTFESTPFQRCKDGRPQFYTWIARLMADFRGRNERQNCNISICTYDTACNDG